MGACNVQLPLVDNHVHLKALYMTIGENEVVLSLVADLHPVNLSALEII